MFLDTEKGSRGVYITVTATFLVASIFAAGRVIGRFGIVKRHGWDDYTFIVAWILAFGLSFTVDFGTSKGFGLYADDTSRHAGTALLRTQYTAIIMFIPALMAAKISILLLYLDIARQSQKFLRVGSYITLAVVLVGGGTLTLMTALRCRPVKAAYSLAAQDPSCIPIQTIWLTAWPINMATELAILVLPIPALATLPLTPLRKTVVMLSFILSVIFIAIVDVARIYNLQLAVLDFQQATDLLLLSPDLSTNANMALLWSAVEVNAAVIGAAIPTLAPVVKWLTSASLRSTRTFSLLFSSQRASRDPPRRNALGYQDSRASTAPALTSDHEPQMNGGRIIPMEYTERTTQPQISDLLPESQDRVYFGFIYLEQPKCIVDMRGSECVKYCSLINLLLFLNGFLYTMLFSINATLPIVQTRTQAVGMVSACYIGAGVFSPSIGYAILRHFGLKATIATSLATSCFGTLIFWPCGAVGSYPGFVVSNVLVGTSLGMMEIVASTFNSLCGPPEYTAVRVLIGTGLEGVGGTLSSLLASKILSIDVAESHNLVALQWAYLVIALFAVLLGLLYWYVPLPQVMDPDLRTRPDILLVDRSKKYFDVLPVMVTSLAVAVLSGFCAAGALSSLRTTIGSVLSSVSANTKTGLGIAISNFQTSLSAVYASGNFLFAILCLFISPRIILIGAYASGITLAVVIASVQFPSASSIQQVTLALSIFLGPIPNLVISIALRGLGWWTALACGLLVSACSLAASIWPWVMLAVSSKESAQRAFYVVVALFVVGSIFPLYLNLLRSTHTRERPPLSATYAGRTINI
ncbi:hypothetical protein FOVSG1_006662 [Fusarium oxysporum f. sp. vasinfectum]